MTRKSTCACGGQHDQHNCLSASYTAPLNKRTWFVDFFAFSVFMCVTCIYMFTCGAHVCEGENAHGHIAYGSPRLMLETIFGCFSTLFPETIQSSPAVRDVATLARQLDLKSPCLCLTRLDFQVAPHCPGNLCGFWRREFPPSCLYSKCFHDGAISLTFYRYFLSKVGLLHKGRTKKIWRMCVTVYAPIYMFLPSQESKVNKI